MLGVIIEIIPCPHSHRAACWRGGFSFPRENGPGDLKGSRYGGIHSAAVSKLAVIMALTEASADNGWRRQIRQPGANRRH